MLKVKTRTSHRADCYHQLITINSPQSTNIYLLPLTYHLRIATIDLPPSTYHHRLATIDLPPLTCNNQLTVHHLPSTTRNHQPTINTTLPWTYHFRNRIVISKLLKRHSKAKCRAPAYSRALDLPFSTNHAGLTIISVALLSFIVHDPRGMME